MLLCKLKNGDFIMIDNSDMEISQNEILDIIEEHMGKDFKDVVKDLFTAIQDKAKDDICEELDGDEAYNEICISKILQITEEALDYLKKDDINKEKINKYLEDIRRCTKRVINL